MAGINQSLMLSLSMVVIASMIAVGGLGQMVLRGIGRLDMGLATVGGLGIVLLAITLDRVTQAMGQPRRGTRHWWQRPARWAWWLGWWHAFAQRLPSVCPTRQQTWPTAPRASCPCNGLTRAHPSAFATCAFPALISSFDRCEPAVVAGAPGLLFKPL